MKKIKSGFTKCRQQYTCKECGRNYSVEIKSTGKSGSIKKSPASLFRGLGFISAGRILNAGNVSVLNRIRTFRRKEKELQVGANESGTVETDEMHTCISQKNCCRIWIAVDRYGKRFINFIAGDRSTETGRKLWEKIREFKMNMTATDQWKPYDDFIPEDRHVRSKAEPFTVEGYNSIFRHFPARMGRKSECYSKSKEMLELFFLLLMKYRNNDLRILT